MKYLKTWCLVVLIGASSCGAKHEIITDSGKKYEVKGNTFYHQGKEVTDKISAEEKDHIVTKLNKKLETEAEVASQQRALKEARSRAEKVQKEARKAEKQAKALDKKLKAEAKARKNYIKAKNNLDTAQKKYNRLRKKGDLSPNEEAKWTKRLNKLSNQMKKADKALNKL
ncbi:hypothetical protein [Bizionia sp.]|uniref:hypothetical protein n=2 Tax=Bizionia sp. TaxID=1954480 RepID=UPI003A8CCEE6